MILALRNCLAQQRLPVFFNPSINLMKSDYDEIKLRPVMGYLRRIANKGMLTLYIGCTVRYKWYSDFDLTSLILDYFLQQYGVVNAGSR